jgi:hypothetical protein
MAFDATRHCLTGCAIGEVLGLAVGAEMGLSSAVTIAMSIVLAFLFGYSLTFIPLLRGGMALAAAAGITLVADTISITVMEIVDNAVVLGIPGAMDASLNDPLFWASLAVSLIAAFIAAYPVNVWLVSRGRGHAIAMGHRGGHG